MTNFHRYIFYAYLGACLILTFAYPTLSLAQENANTNTTQIQPTETIGELWTGSIYSSTFRAGACFDDTGKVKGVLHLTLKNGQVDTYHFFGSMDEHGTIRAKHNSGYRFKGRFDGPVRVYGEVTLNNGFTIDIEGDRLQNSKLTERCGPLPE